MMKKMIAFMAGAVLCSCSSNAKQAAEADNSAQEATPKTLVAYYSATGTTQAVAEEIASQTGGTLYAILPETPYSDADLDWRDEQSRSTLEMHDENARTTLGGEPIDASQYETIYLGFPNWWNLPPRIINSWIESQKLAGKTVIPFMTSGGSGIENSVSYLRRLYPDINWQDGMLINGGREQAKQWIDSNKK